MLFSEGPISNTPISSLGGKVVLVLLQVVTTAIISIATLFKGAFKLGGELVKIMFRSATVVFKQRVTRR